MNCPVSIHLQIFTCSTSGYIPYPGGGEKWGGNGVGDDLYSYGFDGELFLLFLWLVEFEWILWVCSFDGYAWCINVMIVTTIPGKGVTQPVRSLLWEFLSWAFGGKDDCMIVKGARGKMWPSSLLCLLWSTIALGCVWGSKVVVQL